MNNLTELRESILADGTIDAAEVEMIKKVVFADGVIDKEEVEFILDLNKSVPPANKHQTWSVLYVEVLTSYLLDDVDSPGIVDDVEATWLLTKISNNNPLDDCEKALVNHLIKKAKSLPNSISNLV